MTCVKQWRADEEPAPFEESLSPRRRSILFIHLSFFKCGQIGGQHEWLGEHRWTGSSWVTLLCLRHTNSWNKCALIKQPLAVTKCADVQGPSVSNGDSSDEHGTGADHSSALLTCGGPTTSAGSDHWPIWLAGAREPVVYTKRLLQSGVQLSRTSFLLRNSLFWRARLLFTGATTIQIVPDLLTARHWAPFERLTF